MATHDLESPLLHSQLSDSPHLILSVPDSDFSIKQSNNNHHSHNPSPNPNTSSRNPFEFLGSDGLSVPAPSTLDPFKNDTPYIEGLYELIKIVICLPIAIARLVLFGVCLAIGYVATKIALEGWKDMHNPMPKWRSRLMWVTRGCARCILFSFGYAKFLFLGSV
jgi:lysophosphatidylcholine acyltransferase/lyso-PAF acetyltransferase